jgi:uncharacterized protein (DUF4415 family)
MSEERIVRYTLEEVRKLKGKTDWAWLEAQEAAGIEPELDEEEIGIEWDWDSAVMVDGLNKKAISLRVDPDVLAFFKEGGAGYQTRINAVLRAYVKAQKKVASR